MDFDDNNDGNTFKDQHNEEKKRRNEFHEKQNILFHNVLAHLDEQVKAQMDKVDNTDHRKVLIIYTGGTIGMVNTPRGYTIKKNFLKNMVKSNRYLCDTNYTNFNAQDDFVITPVTIYKKRIWFKIVEFDEIKDSSTYNTEDWVNLVSVIEANYDQFDAFVVLHGTDTMAFTASAISFMLENLKKTVVITGSQVPLCEMRNDAFDNFLGALTIAGHFTIPEVTLFFKDKLYRGNRSTKVDAFGLDAFDTPNQNPLGTFGFFFKLDWNSIRKPTHKKFSVQKNMSKKIAVLKVYPMISAQIIENILNTDIEALVIEAYGAGNLPVNRPEIADALAKGCLQGKIIVIVTQCRRGTVNAMYAIGKELVELGVVSGLDMTAESAVTKLSYLLGKNLSKEEVKDLMHKDLRSELTEILPPNFQGHQDTFIKSISDAINMSTEHEALKDALFPTIMCYAADFGYISVLQEVKKFGADLKSGDYEGRTPLHIAAKKGHTEVVQYLIGEGVNLNTVDGSGRSALFEALYNKQFAVSKVLIKAGAKILAEHDDLGDFLFEIVAEGDLDSLRFIYYGGIKNLNEYTNIDDRTLGHIAVAESQVKILEFLKEEAAFNFNTKDRWGRTPLSEAFEIKHPEVLGLFSESIPTDGLNMENLSIGDVDKKIDKAY